MLPRGWGCPLQCHAAGAPHVSDDNGDKRRLEGWRECPGYGWVACVTRPE